MRPFLPTVMLGITLLLTACAATDSPDTVYPPNAQNQKVSRIYDGEILSVSPIRNSQNSNDVWRDAAGAVLEGIGKGEEGGIIGSVLGGIAQRTMAQDVEILVLLAGSNQVIKVVQPNEHTFKTGQHVRVVAGGGILRVLPPAEKPAK